MQKNINYIKQKLSGLYPEREIESFVVWILGHVLGYDRTRILLNNDKILPKDVSAKVTSIVDRLTKFEPIQYITGDTEFAGLNLNVKPGVLVPRPETEELVSRICSKVASTTKRVLDIGTGTGCIALGIKKYMPVASVLGCDISQIALDLANENARLNNLDVKFFYYDVLSMKGDLPVNRFDLIVSNPPYVLESEKTVMEENVLKYEPHSALFVPDDDALLFYRKIIEFAHTYLTDRGELWLEINEQKGSEIKEILINNSFHDVAVIKDIYGKYRFAFGRYRP